MWSSRARCRSKECRAPCCPGISDLGNRSHGTRWCRRRMSARGECTRGESHPLRARPAAKSPSRAP
eukprot:5120562-Prymnesium_polylepis.1